MGNKINLLDLTFGELQEFISGMGLEKFRAGQVFSWLQKGIKNIDDMSNLSKPLRRQLSENAFIGALVEREKLVSRIGGTIKYLFELNDGNIIESVLMEYKHGTSICISSQAGCRMGCSFCASAAAGFMRSLTAGEMLDQVISIWKDTGKRIGNIVVMGIGEPFDNYDNLLKFLKIINSPEGMNIGYRHISVSTCGLVPEILKFSSEHIPVTLSVSLHAPNDYIRNKIMPVSRKYSIDKIIEACKIYTETTKRRITFEYAMIEGMNDSPENARELAGRLKGMLCHVNLIPVNAIPGAGYVKSSRSRMEQFINILSHYGIEATIRRELGSDINAACGQLRRSRMS